MVNLRPIAYSRRYWCFISYSHKDEAVARWLTAAIEGFRVPSRLVGTPGRGGEPVPKFIRPVFRDRDELPASADLGATLREALDASRVLVVLCSPASARSRWVEEEILSFRRSGRQNRILAVILGGRPNAQDTSEECFPEALRFPLLEDGSYDRSKLAEPIAADLTADSRHDVLLRVIAGVLGIAFDDLKQRERRRHFLRRVWTVATTLLIAGVIGGVWWSKQSELDQTKTESSRKFLAAQESAKIELSAEQERKRVEQAREHVLRREWAKAAASLEGASTALPDDEDVRLMEGLALLNFRGQVHSLIGLPDPATVVAWSSDSSMIAAGDQSGHVAWWDAMTAERKGMWRHQSSGKAAAKTLVFLPKPQRLVVGTGVDPLFMGTLASLDVAGSSPPVTYYEETSGKAVCVSSDGQVVAAATVDYDPTPRHRLRVWSAKDGRSLAALNCVGTPKCCVFLPGDERLAVGSDAGNVTIFDWKQNREVMKMEAPVDNFTLFVDNPTQTLWSGARSVLLRGWNLHDFSMTANIPIKTPMEFDPLLLNDTSHQIAFIQGPSSKVIFDLPSTGSGQAMRQPRQLPVPFDFFATAAAFSPDGRTLAVTGSRGESALIDATSGDWLASMHGHEGAASGIAWSPDGRHLATCGTDRRVIEWDVSQLRGAPATKPCLSGYPVTKVRPCGSRRDMIAFQAHMEIGISDRRGLKTATIRHPIDECVTLMAGVHFALSPEGTHLASCGGDKTVRVWDVSTQQEVRKLTLEKGVGWDVAWSSDGRRLIVSSGAREVVCWDLDSEADFPLWRRPGCTATQLDLNRKGDLIFAGGSIADAAHLLDADTGQVRIEFPVAKGQTMMGFFSSTGSLLITHGTDEFCHIISTESGKEIARTAAHVDRVRTAACSPDGKILATCDTGGRVRFWTLPGCEEAGQWQEPGKFRIYSLCFSPTGQHLVAGAISDVHVISMTRKTSVARFFSPNEVNDVQFDAQGERLLVACGPQVRQIELTPSESERRELTSRASRLNPYKMGDGGVQIKAGVDDGDQRAK